MSLASTAKRLAKRILFESGALDLYRRAFLAETLTVVMFHRVLPPNDPRFRAADPAYTMRLEIFECCLQVFRRSYNIVSLEDVQAAVAGGRALPRRALLITFDDGWEDTARYAVPALRKFGMPCVVFVASDAVKSELTLWKDVATCVWRAAENSRAGTTGREHPTVDALIAWLASLKPRDRDRWLETAVDAASQSIRPLMMTPRNIQTLVKDGIAIGGHGASHTPLTEVQDLADELERCSGELAHLTEAPIRAFAFPHGVHSPETIAAVERAGFALRFTSEPCLNRVQDGRPRSMIFGRLDLPERALIGGKGQFELERLAYWLTMRPIQSLSMRHG